MRQDGRLYRSNELWRETRLKSHGAPLLKTERLYSNFAEVRYEPGPGVVVHEEP